MTSKTLEATVPLWEMEKEYAENVLKVLVQNLLMGFEDFFSCSDNELVQFQCGEKIVHVECLECIQMWDKAAQNGLNFKISNRYTLR